MTAASPSTPRQTVKGPTLRILALEPYYGGSHRAFLDGWRARSRHDWTVLGLDDHHWKWRMRHAPVTLARELDQRLARGERWDICLASDMLDLPALLGQLSVPAPPMATVAYFHENQLTYPDARRRDYDAHFAYTNITTAQRADAVWFNSHYHRTSFLSAAEHFLQRMPDHRERWMIEAIASKATVQYPGIDLPARPREIASPPRNAVPEICWIARWEADKRPDLLLEALRELRRRQLPFRVSVLGAAGERAGAADFDAAQREFAEEVVEWGYLPSAAHYQTALARADIVFSTADHEFFGIAVLEAVAAGAWPVVPAQLAYPEVLHNSAGLGRFYAAGEHVDALVAEVAAWPDGVGEGDALARQVQQRYGWGTRSQELDEALMAVSQR